jgi:hypothetical protein|tara:strand:+ start:2804 stop:5167 length:2364 start_codon:yes stop_codon:yes gene_type:complete
MFIKYFILVFLSSFIFGQPTNIEFGGGPHRVDELLSFKCISDEERSAIKENRIVFDHHGTMRDTVLFQDPLGNGGMMNHNDSAHHYINNFVDQNNSTGYVLDYNCTYVTYDGHQGTDIDIGGFYYMDEMKTPILAAAPGIVSYSHDGEFDRRTSLDNSAVSNAVIISHSDGTFAWYLHMKENSVSVMVGDTIFSGDTLGFVGSSGFSTGPHLHFEVEAASGNTIDPWEGECGDGPSLWADQLPFIGDTSVYDSKLLGHLSTAYPINGNNETFNYILDENLPNMQHINPGNEWVSATYISTLFYTDTLKIVFYRDDVFVDEWWWVPGNTNYWYTGLDSYTSSFWYWFGTWGDNLEDPYGEWTEKHYINSQLIGENSYVCDDIPNQSPSVDFQQISVEVGKTVTGEFTATDDGDPFWFNIESNPNNGGSLELLGGRKRKFEYTAPSDFIGNDVVGISATDDRGVTGAMTFIIFEVSGSGLTNLEVSPSYVNLMDSVFISADNLGDLGDASVLASIHDINSDVVFELELIQNEGLWSGYWIPENESFFNVDLQLVRNNESDEIVLYENVGSFTSIGPVEVTMLGELNGYPENGISLGFTVDNNSSNEVAPDISIQFEAENMNCLTDYSQDTFFLGDIDAGETLLSNPYLFVALLNNECNSDSTILIHVHIRSGEEVYWYNEFILNVELLTTVEEKEIPIQYSLGGAYPNPFNPVARIDYDLTQESYVYFEIHNLMGQKVKTLVSSEKNAGFHSTYWDATNNAGDPVSAGVYLYTIQAGEFRQTKKMILLK